jgi:transposase
MKPFRETAKKKHTVRYETLPSEQMQVDWKEVGEVVMEGRKSQVIAICGHVRLFADEIRGIYNQPGQKHLMECLIQSFKYFGGIPQKVLFDNMKTVTDGRERLSKLPYSQADRSV